ncbi:MAG: hypothetical protein ACKV2V_25100, partial [Blastocatellia bacterium]
MNLPDWMNAPVIWLSLLSGLVGAIWALSEIIGEFRAETGRALRTWGAWLLLAVNFLAAAVIFLLASGVVPALVSWPSALAVGFSWPTFFRNASLKLAQPINETTGGETAAIRVEQAYGAIQKLALQLINSRLTRQRTQLMSDAARYSLDDLEKFARRMLAFSPQQIDPKVIDEVLQREMDEDAKKAYLAALLMNTFTRSALDDFIRGRRKTGAKELNA